MSTTIIGVGRIGGALARDLVRGGERVVLAARDETHAQALAEELGPLASAASRETAIGQAGAVVFAVWLNQIEKLVADYKELLGGKVVVDPSDPVTYDEKGQAHRTLPDGTTAASVVASLLLSNAHYVKAFGSLGAQSLASEANRAPRRAVLFYATDDDRAAAEIERLINAAGFDPVKVGGVRDAARIEVPGGDLHQNSGLHGRLVDVDEARAAIAAAPV